ncbi:major facilitator family protein, partial [Cystoisospora suis]
MWKGWYEFVTVCTESLFNDSIPQGRRSELYVHRRIVTTLANGVGPLFSLFVFYVEGNSWNLSVLHTVLHVGLILSLPQAFVLWMWRDVLPPPSPSSLSLSSSSCSSKDQDFPSYQRTSLKTPSPASAEREEEEEVRGDEADLSVLHTTPSQPVALSASSEEREDKEEEDAKDGAVEEDEEDKRGILTGVCTHHSHVVNKDSLGERKERRQIKKSRAVPWLVFISHCITFSGAGMTVKYFPLFFKSEYQLQPIHMCLLSSVYTLFIAFFTYAIQRMAVRIGRPQASLLSTGLGI